ncbi:hypothetical protein Cgig2_009799 [Carnegiea gigantea]|uniref:Uncharacterized protein n=1 Tax=Carnegiea gigantea TaxID=171969 RepID=A0A9Q1JJ22_9CARY|nr:hypothetical protein Cgig2_009799 [Carnegiea gigantea]
MNGSPLNVHTAACLGTLRMFARRRNFKGKNRGNSNYQKNIMNNKTPQRRGRVFKRIDKALHNTMWYDTFDYTHVFYQPQGLSDHSLISLDFPTCPKPRKTFQFYDMWVKDPHFMDIIAQQVDKKSQASKLQTLKSLLCNLRRPLSQLNKNKFADIYAQQAKARGHLTQTYVSITSFALSLIKQQSKAEWIGFGNESSRYFMAKIRHRKAKTNVYQLKDTHDNWVEGFEKDICKETLQDWGIKLQVDGLEQCIASLQKLKGARQIRGLVKAIVDAVIHHIWQARNFIIFKEKTQATADIVRAIREQITQRVLHLHHHSHNCTQCIDFLFSRNRQ